MPDTTDKPIVVSKNAGILDTLSAAGRYVAVILTSAPILMTLLGSGNFTGLVDFFRGNDGNTLIAAAIGLGTLAWGLFKTRKRGAQIATVAMDTRVPNSIAKTG